MPCSPFGNADPLLPLLLALPAGTIAGLHATPGALGADLESSLARFGPRLGTEAALRYAALRPPPQAVVELEPGATVASDTALSRLSAAGSVVLLIAHDLGTLARLCHRILRLDSPSPGWVAAESLRAGRGLLVRIEGRAAAGWLRLPLGGAAAEGILASCRARGLAVLESRVDYESAVAR